MRSDLMYVLELYLLCGYIYSAYILLITVIFEGTTKGRRITGRPQRRWKEDIKEWTNLEWNERNANVKDRVNWIKQRSGKRNP